MLSAANELLLEKDADSDALSDDCREEKRGASLLSIEVLLVLDLDRSASCNKNAIRSTGCGNKSSTYSEIREKEADLSVDSDFAAPAYMDSDSNGN